MKKSRYREYLVSALLVICSIYLPLVSLSFFIEFLPTRANKVRFSESAIRQKEVWQKKKLRNSGFRPTYHPFVTKDFFSRESKVYPVGSLPYTNSYLCDEGYGLITFRTDRVGLRNPDNLWDYVRAQNSTFIIGDSFIHGACVSDSHTISAQLQMLLHLPTLNLGTSGASPYEYLAALRYIVEPIINTSAQDIKHTVIVSFYANDFIHNDPASEERLSAAQFNAVVTNTSTGVDINPNYNQGLIAGLDSISLDNGAGGTTFRDGRLYKALSLYSMRKVLLNRIASYFQSMRHESAASPHELAIKELKLVCGDSLCDPLILYIPNSNFWRPDPRSIAFKDSLSSLAQSYSIPFHDMTDVINPDDRSHYSPSGGHLSHEGYKRVANYLARILAADRER